VNASLRYGNLYANILTAHAAVLPSSLSVFKSSVFGETPSFSLSMQEQLNKILFQTSDILQRHQDKVTLINIVPFLMQASSHSFWIYCENYFYAYIKPW
jgi:hypothetical protein